MHTDSNTLCYQGIQRIYRNSVVKHIREILLNTYGDLAIEQLKSPFKHEWDKITQDAYSTRASGELNSKISDPFDLLSVNHFFNLFDKFYDILIPTTPNEIEKEKSRYKTTILNWLKEIKNIRDPLSHPAEESFDTIDVFRILDSARRVLLRIGDISGADNLNKMIQKDLFNKSGINKIDDQLPPKESIVIDFVGRKKQIDELWIWFSDPLMKRWALSGDGGKGKSAIAYEFATQVLEKAPEPFVTVLWLSAKKVKFSEGSIVRTNQVDFNNFDSALNSILVQYGWHSEINTPTQSKSQKVLELFNEFPALVIVDDVDSLDVTEEDTIEFFSLTVPRTHSKVLFTSRRQIFGMGKTTTNISGFEKADGYKFIESRCKLMTIDENAIDNNIKNDILKATDGSPLFVEDLLRYATSSKSLKDAIDDWTTRGGHEARRYALGRECEMLSRQGRAILLAASLGEHSFSYTELQSITNLSEISTTSGIQELQTLFLVPKPLQIDGEFRYELNRNTRALIHELYNGSEEYQKYRKAYTTIFKDTPNEMRYDVASVIRQAMLKIKSPVKDFEGAEKILKTAIANHPTSDLHGVLGVVYKSWKPRRLSDAREQFERAIQLKTKKTETFIHWLQMEKDEDNWLNVVKVTEKALKQFPNDLYMLVAASQANTRYAKLLRNNFDNEKAIEYIKRSIDYALQAIKLPNVQLDNNEIELLSDAYRCLVISFETKNDVKNIYKYLIEWNKFNPLDEDFQSEYTRLNRKYHLEIIP